MSDKRLLEDWGAYEPETQKALRFVSLHDKGAAKQVAHAIVQEYAKREQSKPTRKPIRKKSLTYYDLKVLSILKSAGPNMEYEIAVQRSGFSAELFSESLDTLVEQGYLVGDAFLGYVRTKKRLPQVLLTEEDIADVVDTWIAKHPHIHFDEQKRQSMIRMHILIQKTHGPGWML